MKFEFPYQLAPDVLRPWLETNWAHFAERRTDHPPQWSAEFAGEVVKVWSASEFVAQSCTRDPNLLDRLTNQNLLAQARKPGDIAAELARRLADAQDESVLSKTLRIFRCEELVRIAWRDITGRADLDETLADLSELADRCLEEALSRLDAWQQQAWGTPTGSDGQPQTFCVLAMGKLGGQELNFSSDIDLIFVFGEEGQVAGPQARSNTEYFIRLGQSLIRVIDQLTADGFVFRVDMRLRPNGQSGPLVLPFDAFENYYANSGRDWERYAMIKARPVAGDLGLGEQLLSMLRPFVYRRYLDFNAIDSLRDMKRMITSEVGRRGAGDDIKLGEGGIRDVEFLAQSLQLLWGGRYPTLRTRSVREALVELAELKFVDSAQVQALLDGYVFLRQLENRLQAIADRQTQRLPDGEIEQARLAHAMGFDSYGALQHALDDKRRPIIAAFDDVVAADVKVSADEMAHARTLLWAGGLSEEQALIQFAEVNVAHSEEALRRLEQFRTSPAVRSLSETGRARLDRLMPLILAEIGETAEPQQTLYRALRLLEAIVRRTTYVSLLVENPQARAELINLIGASAWIAERLGRHPILLDELLYPEALHSELPREALVAELARRMASITPGDVEQEMEVLREFKGAQVLHVAAAEVGGRKHLMKVSDALSDIAEVALESTVALAWRDITQKWGDPYCGPAEKRRMPGFGVVGYGKLGGLELGYGSDLDLVFLHESAGEQQITDGEKCIDNSVFFARVGQRIVHYLSTLTPGGVAYEVDMRLRPSGNSGLLVAAIEAFASYQREDAWTWEHQALVRARFVAGDTAIERRFNTVRHEILSQHRDIDALRKDVIHMRQRMYDALDKKPGFDIKQSPGGMIDIEFIAQFGVLAWAHAYPELTRWSDNVRIFESFSRAGLMDHDEAQTLTDAYLMLRSENHRLSLLETDAVLTEDALIDVRGAVQRLWQKYVLAEPELGVLS